MVFGVSNAKYLAFDTPDENALTCANIDGEYLSHLYLCCILQFKHSLKFCIFFIKRHKFIGLCSDYLFGLVLACL